jgi:hypothetical protein
MWDIVIIVMTILFLLIISLLSRNGISSSTVTPKQWAKIKKGETQVTRVGVVNEEHKKPKVAVVCYDDRNTKNIIKLKDINEKYCKAMGYDFLFFTEYPEDDKYPPYWIKVKIVKDILMSDKYDYVMWIDSDACFCDHKFEIPWLFYDSKTSFVMSSEDGLFPCDFNAGVWFVKNDDIGKEFMEEWIDGYNEKMWWKTDKGWGCRGNWAGIYYEQGYGSSIMKQKKYKEHIKCFPWTAFQEIHDNSDAFVLHFYGDRKKRINSLKL